jgi:hypothetical protein
LKRAVHERDLAFATQPLVFTRCDYSPVGSVVADFSPLVGYLGRRRYRLS